MRFHMTLYRRLASLKLQSVPVSSTSNALSNFLVTIVDLVLLLSLSRSVRLQIILGL